MNKPTNIHSLTICLHYGIEDDRHAMDALTLNKSEAEILAIIQETAKALDLPITIETEALQAGSIKKFLNMGLPDMKVKHQLALCIIIKLIQIALFGSIQRCTDRLMDHAIECIMEDEHIRSQRDELERLKLEVELNEYRLILANQTQQLDTQKINKRASNHYEHLSKCTSVSYFELSYIDELGQEVTLGKLPRPAFHDHILTSNEVEPIIDDNATIEIVSPVIKDSSIHKAKWTGIYRGESIRFYMHDRDYRKDIIGQRVHFQHGSVIECTLEIKRRLTQEGEVQAYDYIVQKVFEPHTTTPRSRSRRRQHKANLTTADLFEGLYND